MKHTLIFLFLFTGIYCIGQQELILELNAPDTIFIILEKEKAEIEFLSKSHAALAILDESYEPYFSQLQLREISAFVGEEVSDTNLSQAREFAKERFSAAVTDFTDDEKECITFVLVEVIRILEENSISLMAGHDWTFIKIEDWLCGGFAHTRGTYIILSQRHIEHLSKGWSKDMSEEEKMSLLKRFGSLLVHEQMHSLQRMYPGKFARLYSEYWNFVHAIVETEKSIQLDQVSNPDAPVAYWLVPDKQNDNQYYWVRTMLKATDGIPVMGKDFTNKVFIVEKEDDVYSVKRDEDGKLMSTTLSEIDYYVNSFPPNRGIDHPNEISAYMFAEYFVSLVSNTKAFEDVSPEASENSELFLEWVDSEMKK